MKLTTALKLGLIGALWAISIQSIATIAHTFPDRFALVGLLLGPATLLLPMLRGWRVRVCLFSAILSGWLGFIWIARDLASAKLDWTPLGWSSAQYITQALLSTALLIVGIWWLQKLPAEPAAGDCGETTDERE